MTGWPRLAILGLSLAVTLSACGDPAVALHVSAAASLTESFGELEAAFEAAHPGTDVVLNIGGSSALRDQIIEGAPVDVFASASIDIMDVIVDADLAGEPTVFAANRLVLAVPTGNPANVAGLRDLAREDLLIGLCDEGVPCGSLARTVLEAAGVDPAVDSREPNVRALLTKLEAGELDAGLVYTTDAIDGDVESIEFEESGTFLTRYPIAVLTAAADPGVAAEFVAFVTSSEGRSILEAHGFVTP